MRSEDRLVGLDVANVNLSDFIAAMVSAAPGSVSLFQTYLIFFCTFQLLLTFVLFP